MTHTILSETSEKMLSIVYKMSSLLTEPSSVDRVLDSIIQSVTEGLGFYRASLYLINREKQLLECKCISGFTLAQENRARTRPYDLTRHDSLETKVALTGQPILVRDANDDPILTDIDHLITKMFERGCILYVPLKVKGTTIGILGVDKRRDEPGISEQEFESLSIFANYASIIIENSRLYEALLDEKKFSEDIVNSSLRGALTVNLLGRITHLNPAGESLLGLKREKVLNRPLEDVFKCFEEMDGMIRRALLCHESIKGYEHIVKRDGKQVILNVSTSPILDDAGNIRGSLFTMEDITAERERGEYLQRMNRLIALGELAAGVAHEIRNPLTGIGVVLDILRQKKGLSRSNTGLLDEAAHEIERLEKLISDLLDFARPKKLNFEPGNINDIVQSIYFLISEQCNNQGIRLSIRYGENLPRVCVDYEKIRQGLLNIVINAIHAMPGGGSLTIDTGCGKGLEGSEEDPCIVVSITDTGSGIPDAVRGRVFDPFFTTHHEGTGLGLSITHSIVKEHRGTVRFDTEEGRGTCFSVLLPMDRTEDCKSLKSHAGERVP
jgi:PAS domain S-box-containing protein